jgi:hypothetical protein
MAKLKMGIIKDDKDQNRFCGPSIISAVTALTTGEAARLIRKQTGRKMVTGTYSWEVKKALKSCNVKMTAKKRFPYSVDHSLLNRTTGPTLAMWLRMSKQDRTAGRVFLIVAGWHWQLVSGRRYTCGRVREIISIRDKRVKRRARVAAVYELTSDNVIKPEIDVTKPKDPNASVRAKVHRIAKEIGVEIVTHGPHDPYKEVYPPPWLHEGNDPYDGEHMVYDWQEALVMVEEYKKIVEQR